MGLDPNCPRAARAPSRAARAPPALRSPTQTRPLSLFLSLSPSRSTAAAAVAAFAVVDDDESSGGADLRREGATTTTVCNVQCVMLFGWMEVI